MIASADDRPVATYIEDISVLASRLGYALKLELSGTTVPFLDLEITISDRGHTAAVSTSSLERLTILR